MNYRINIGFKIALLVLLIVTGSVLVISYVSYDRFIAIAESTLTNVEVNKLLEREAELKWTFVSLIVLIVLFSVSLSLILSRLLIVPIISLKENLLLMEKGVLLNQIEGKVNDEIGEMAHTMNNLVQSLKRTAEFAHSIGEGTLNASFSPLSEDDVLGNSLINMQKSLVEADLREKERAWIVNGVAEVGEILRRHNLIDPLSNDIVKYMVEKTGAIQGVFYSVEEREDGSDREIVMKNCYAYNRKKYLTTSFKFGEGLVGQAAIESATIFRTEIPSDYCTITSGLLKDKKPNSILIVPLITDEEIYGLLEFASLNHFKENEIRFVEEVGPIIARTVSNIFVNERTQRHLEISQKMSKELQQQQEELRQNAEEMQATQEDLQKANISLEEQMEEVNRTRNRMQSLLENASEVISIYEVDGKIRYISPSVKNILGLQPEYLIGSKDDLHIHSEDMEGFKNMFKKLIVSPDIPITIQYRYRKK